VYPRLQQLRAELETSTSSPKHGILVLYGIRRELLRHRHDMPYAHLLVCPSALRAKFYQTQQALKQPPAFPTPSASAQFVATTQALDVLEQVATCQSKQEEFPA
jgi:hypothetical protein